MNFVKYLSKKILKVTLSFLLVNFLMMCKVSTINVQDLKLKIKKKNPIELQILNKLSYDEKVNQLIMVPYHHAKKNLDENYGGIIYIGHHFIQAKYFKNLKKQNKIFLNNKIKPLIALDQEGGLVDRLAFLKDFEKHCDKGVKDFMTKYFDYQGLDDDTHINKKYKKKRNRKKGKIKFRTPSQESIFKIYRDLTDDNKKEFLEDYKNYAKSLAKTIDNAGFNINFAPTLDIVPNVDSKKYIIARENRSMGSDPKIASELARAYLDGFKEYAGYKTKNKVLTTAKHFPGLGYGKTDTHQHETIISKTLDELINSSHTSTTP